MKTDELHIGLEEVYLLLCKWIGAKAPDELEKKFRLNPNCLDIDYLIYKIDLLIDAYLARKMTAKNKQSLKYLADAKERAKIIEKQIQKIQLDSLLKEKE